MPPTKRAKAEPIRAQLPPVRFFYTLDQIAGIIGVKLDYFKRTYVFFEGLTVGAHRPDKLRARDLAPRFEDEPTRRDWRVEEEELIRWMEFKGFRTYRRDIRIRRENPYRTG